MKFSWIMMMVLLLYMISGCNIKNSEINESIDESYTVSVYAARDDGNGSFKKSDSPFFTEANISKVEFKDGDVSSFKIYFTEEYLSNYNSESVIEKYEKGVHVGGLRIYTSNEWDMFELQINGESQFYGYFPMGMASSFFGAGPHMNHDVEGVTLIMNIFNQDLLGIDSNDEKTLYEAFNSLGLIQD